MHGVDGISGHRNLCVLFVGIELVRHPSRQLGQALLKWCMCLCRDSESHLWVISEKKNVHESWWRHRFKCSVLTVCVLGKWSLPVCQLEGKQFSKMGVDGYYETLCSNWRPWNRCTLSNRYIALKHNAE